MRYGLKKLSSMNMYTELFHMNLCRAIGDRYCKGKENMEKVLLRSCLGLSFLGMGGEGILDCFGIFLQGEYLLRRFLR